MNSENEDIKKKEEELKKKEDEIKKKEELLKKKEEVLKTKEEVIKKKEVIKQKEDEIKEKEENLKKKEELLNTKEEQLNKKESDIKKEDIKEEIKKEDIKKKEEELKKNEDIKKKEEEIKEEQLKTKEDIKKKEEELKKKEEQLKKKETDLKKKEEDIKKNINKKAPKKEIDKKDNRTDEEIKKEAEFKESIKHIEIHLLVIKYGNVIEDISWKDEDYSKKISELDTYDTCTTTNEKFVDTLGEKIETDKITTIPRITIKKSIIFECPTHIYEMMYIDLADVKDKDKEADKINNVATLLNTNGDIVYYNAIIIKTRIETLTEKMTIDNISSNDIHYILYYKVYTNIVIYDIEWKPIVLKGSMEEYCACFFENLRYKQFEIKFLLHNINIWYIENRYDESICDNLIKTGIEKCVIFIKNSPNIRGHITIEEVKKILHLSKVLPNYQVPDELTGEKRDSYGRNIIYNKYKILDYLYDKNS